MISLWYSQLMVIKEESVLKYICMCVDVCMHIYLYNCLKIAEHARKSAWWLSVPQLSVINIQGLKLKDTKGAVTCWWRIEASLSLGYNQWWGGHQLQVVHNGRSALSCIKISAHHLHICGGRTNIFRTGEPAFPNMSCQIHFLWSLKKEKKTVIVAKYDFYSLFS